MNFRPRKEHELDHLDDDALVAYIAAARDAGHRDEARTALGILAYRRYDDLVRRISICIATAWCRCQCSDAAG